MGIKNITEVIWRQHWKGRKKQCNQREEDTGQDRDKHSCCPVHHTPNCFNRTWAACCLYVVCPHRHNGMNNYLWCSTCDYQNSESNELGIWLWLAFALLSTLQWELDSTFVSCHLQNQVQKKWNEGHWKQVLWITLLLAIIWHTFKSVSWWTLNFVLEPGKWS